MKRLFLFLIATVAMNAYSQDIWILDSTEVHVEITLDSSLIEGAWDVNWGPDDKLWFTDLEYIQRYDPVSGTHDTLLYRQGDNALGFAIHNDLLNGTPYVFVAYDTSAYYAGGAYVNLYRYEYSNGQLINPLLLISYNHAGEHAGGRVIISQDDKVLITTADYWFGIDPLKGRTLRLNFDGTIPSDNPNPLSYEFTSGHRNPQGLVQTPNGKIYNSEHGQAGNDEINLLVSGGHYGWPAYDGDNCTGVVMDSCNSVTYSYVSPLHTITAPPSGVDYYGSNVIPEFTNCLLVGTLWGSMALDAYTLDASGDNVVLYHKYLNINGYGRIRDVAVAPDGSLYFIGFDRQAPNAIYHLYNPNVSGITKTEEIRNFSLYPNPAHDEINLSWVSPDQDISVIITDLSGKCVYSRDLPAGSMNHTIEITDFMSGVYVVEVRLKDGGGSKRMKFAVR